MRDNMYRIMVLVFMMTVMISCNSTTVDTPELTIAELGEIAPNFTLDNNNGGTDELHSNLGKVVLIDFWATWCGPCRATIPKLSELWYKYRDKDFALISVSTDKSTSDWLEYIDENGMVWSQLHDSFLEASRIYDVQYIPKIFLLDKEGRIQFIGHPASDEIEILIKQYLEL